MKRNLIFGILLFSLLLGCDSSGEQVSDTALTKPLLPSSMKGYELYSWKTGGQWSYTLITGTNRNKAYDEIVTSDNFESVEWVKISVYDFKSLKQLLVRVPANESISWISSPSRVSGFSLPESSLVSEVEKYCSSHDLELQIVR